MGMIIVKKPNLTFLVDDSLPKGTLETVVKTAKGGNGQEFAVPVVEYMDAEFYLKDENLNYKHQNVANISVLRIDDAQVLSQLNGFIKDAYGIAKLKSGFNAEGSKVETWDKNIAERRTKYE